MPKQDKPKIVLTPEMEKFKYEVAQEIGIANRKHKK
ncbi:MAG: small, acid-soluble spore protein, alpha/beta type [Desulfitobacteriaceae bacterium]